MRDRKAAELSQVEKKPLAKAVTLGLVAVGILGAVMYFATSGPQTIRIQQREDGLSIDQIVLSPSSFLTAAPGSLKNDATVLQKQ